VKTTNDLLVLRSDVYEVTPDGLLVQQEATAPLVDLDSRYYKTIGAFERRFAEGAPALRQAQRLKVEGDWTFGAGVTVVGDVVLADPGEPRTVRAGSTVAG
jgi:UTP--glucose-1-phosphate uridylyltransferase